MEVHFVQRNIRAARQFVKGKEFSPAYFVASVLSGGNLPAYFTTTSTFMAIKLLCETLAYSNVPLSLLFSFAFKIGKWC